MMEETNHNSQFSTLNSQFSEIRPYEAGEMKEAFEALLADRQFNLIMKGFAPWLPQALRNGLLRLAFKGVKTPLDFQKRFMKPVVNYIIRKHTDGCTFDDSKLPKDKKQRYTFVSNHRDIVLDSAFLDVMLFNSGYPTTVEIGIGDNLLIYPWIKRLVRMNKAFTVRRGLTAHEMMRSSELMSRYIHYAVTEKRENIWIAQREGRAKDSDDRTQESVLKMLAMGGPLIDNGELRMENYDYTGNENANRNDNKNANSKANHNSCAPTVASDQRSSAQFSIPNSQFLSSLKELNIVPLTISYEFDPCDYLKAQEFQQKRDNPSFKKSKQDDLDNMKTGILGYKGQVVYRCGQPINAWIDELKDLPKNEFFTELARRMDQEIHAGYELYTYNYLALDMLNGNRLDATEEYLDHDTKLVSEIKAFFEQYLKEQIAKIQLPNKDEAFLRERLLTMYANPLRNYLATQQA